MKEINIKSLWKKETKQALTEGQYCHVVKHLRLLLAL